MSKRKREEGEGDVGGFAARWRLEGKRVLVTGSTKGIGKVTAEEMLSLGASVIIHSRNQKEITELVTTLEEQYPGKVHGCAADVGSSDGRTKLIEFTLELWGGALDCLINNVGRNIREKIQDQSEEQYHSMMRVNVDSCYFLCKGLYQALLKGNSATVVNVSSAAGLVSSGTGAVYGMTKAAMVQLTKNLACEWGKDGIRVNCVAPWMCNTPMLQEAVKNDPSQLEKVQAWTPLQVYPPTHAVSSIFLSCFALI
jgi:Tropinone reductase 1